MKQVIVDQGIIMPGQPPTGDAHCQGVHIVINCTFTAGGLFSLLFVVVHGLGKEEIMSEDDMVTIKVPGLTVGSDQDIYSFGR